MRRNINRRLSMRRNINRRLSMRRKSTSDVVHELEISINSLPNELRKEAKELVELKTKLEEIDRLSSDIKKRIEVIEEDFSRVVETRLGEVTELSGQIEDVEVTYKATIGDLANGLSLVIQRYKKKKSLSASILKERIVGFLHRILPKFLRNADALASVLRAWDEELRKIEEELKEESALVTRIDIRKRKSFKRRSDIRFLFDKFTNLCSRFVSFVTNIANDLRNLKLNLENELNVVLSELDMVTASRYRRGSDVYGVDSSVLWGLDVGSGSTATIFLVPRYLENRVDVDEVIPGRLRDVLIYVKDELGKSSVTVLTDGIIPLEVIEEVIEEVGLTPRFYN